MEDEGVRAMEDERRNNLTTRLSPSLFLRNAALTLGIYANLSGFAFLSKPWKKKSEEC
jgi:hypothetical protein